MNTTRFNNLDEITKDYIARNPMNPAISEREEITTMGSAFLHTLTNEEELIATLSIVVRSRNIISELIWSLEDENGSLFIDTQNLIGLKYPKLDTMYQAPRKDLIEFCASLLADQSVLGFIYQAGSNTLRVVRGVRSENSVGHFLITSLNAYPS